MTESLPAGAGTPAAANMQPLSPEVQFHGHLSNLAGDVLAHYEAQQVTPRHIPNRYKEGRSTLVCSYRDGTERQVITDTEDGTVETKVRAPGNIRDQYGRRVLLVKKEYTDGSRETEYDLCLSTTSDSKRTTKTTSSTYRWTATRPVAEVHGPVGAEREALLAAGTPEFNEAWMSVAYANNQWLPLIRPQR